MSDRRQRLADNEAAFRDINEQAARQPEARKQQLEQGQRRIVCECADSDCAEPVTVTLAEYRMVRRHPSRFLIAPGHDHTDIERVVYLHDRYWIVEKHPDLDP